MPQDLLSLATEYHRALPDRLRNYLHARGISDELIALHRLGWNGQRITLPVTDRDGVVTFFKLAKDPEDQSNSPKMLTATGASIELYGWERVLANPYRLIICEGEFDRLVLEAQGFAAVTSTGGAGAFRAEWATDLKSIPEVFLCFDRDEAGRKGALRVGQLLPHGRIVQLPEDVGAGGDVTDFFVRLGHTRDDFSALLDTATPVSVAPEGLPVWPTVEARQPSPFADRVARLKAALPIAEVVGQYVTLRLAGRILRGLCPFHEDHVPSLVVYRERGTFHCFGCGSHGDVITFLMTIEKISFLQALAALERVHPSGHGNQQAA